MHRCRNMKNIVILCRLREPNSIVSLYRSAVCGGSAHLKTEMSTGSAMSTRVTGLSSRPITHVTDVGGSG